MFKSMWYGVAVALSLVMWTAGDAVAEPTYVDLSSVANRALEDDGVSGNGQGGWSDEGANDMFVYPPIPAGKVTRNGHHFLLADPTDAHKPTVIMLRGAKMPDLPQQVEVPVADVKGKYIYFLQSLTRIPANVGDGEVAQYTVKYADGSSEKIALHAGKELRHWWAGTWYENSGANSWPIFMGVNAYSVKWKKSIGVWAMRWTNPHPDKAIAGITLASNNTAVPAILAITIDNEDYHASDQLKADYKRPPGAPVGYFDGKLAIERQRVFEEMVKRDMVKGIRRVEVIAPDMLAVTLDAWVAQGPGSGQEKAAAMQSPDAFTVTAGPNAVAIAKVGRKSYEYWNGNIGPFQQNMLYWHTYYLKLAEPLPDGAACTVTAKEVPAPFTGKVTLEFDPARSITRVIKVNQVAYAEGIGQRYAYLGWWAADLGAVDYDQFKSFTVIDEKSGRPAMQRPIELRAASDELSGERVYQMDLTALKRGQYHIVVHGLGRSSSFGVGGEGIDELYKQTNRAYYHQRSGTPLAEPYTTFATPAHHYRVTKSGRVVGDEVKGTANDPVRKFVGGYHDAADFDVFTYHLRATSQTLAAYAMHPKAFGDGDLNIPESGNRIPDVLDEAGWALQIYLELQEPTGAVPLGLGFQQDAQRDYERKHGQAPPFGIFPPTDASSPEYAAVAAQYARLIKPFDTKRAAKYLASAKKALAYSLAHAKMDSDTVGPFVTWAAAEMYCTTGDPADLQTFVKLYRDGGFKRIHWKLASVWPTFVESYLLCQHANVDKEIQQELRQLLIRKADGLARSTDVPAYRMGRGTRGGGMGWGNGNGGGFYACTLLLAHHLTGEQRYLDAASLNADFQLGCNPLSKTFISGMGDRPPSHPQIAPYLYTGPNKTGTTVKGITIYGIASREPAWYPASTPPWRRWRDLGGGGAEVSSEFTITETIGESSMLYSTLHALQRAERPAGLMRIPAPMP